MTEDRVRVALVGAGGAGLAHLQALQTLSSRAEVVGVMDRSADRAAGLAALSPGCSAFTAVDELIRRTAPDLVIVCTPPGSHREPTLLAAERGAAVLVEKPAAVSLAELDRLADRPDAPIAVVAQHRFGPAAVLLRELAGAGELGCAMGASCETAWFRDDAYFDSPWHGDWDAAGGGPTLTLGIHQIDLLLAVLGPWAEVSAFAARRARPTQTEDLSVAAVRLGSGALASVYTSALSPRESSRLRFDFEYASVEIEHLYGYRSSEWRFTPAPGHERIAELWSPGPSHSRSGLRDQLEAVLDALGSGGALPVGLDDARVVMDLCAAMYKSAFTGAPVRAGTIDRGDPYYVSMRGDGPPWSTEPS